MIRMEASTLFLALSGLFMPTGVGAAAINHRAQSYPGFDKIGQLFTFGNSYSQTGFNGKGTQPSPGNPLGNPEYPGDTSANGPNWIDYLTVEYNQSSLLTYNFAYSGATVDKTIIDCTVDIAGQVHDSYLPLYGSGSNSQYPNVWEPSTSLFGIFIGINDVTKTYTGDWASINAEVFKAYSSLVEELYQSGARNFFLLNVPSVDRSPSGLALSEAARRTYTEDIASFNKGVSDLAKNLSTNHEDTTVFYYDTNTLFSDVLDDPSQYPETALYKNTTGYCEKYEGGTPEPDTFYQECGIPANQYFWKDSLHPTDPVHKALAKGLATMFEKGDAL